MPLKDFVKEYLKVQDATFQPNTIQGAWKKSGCYPPHLDIFTDVDYAPSIPFSTSTPSLLALYPTLNIVLTQNILSLDQDIESESEQGSDSGSNESDTYNDDNDNEPQGPQSPLPSTLHDTHLTHTEPPITSSQLMPPLAPPSPFFLSSLPLPLPPQPTYLTTIIPPAPNSRLHHKCTHTLEDKVNQLQSKIKHLHGEVDVLKTHNTIARHQLLLLQHRVNSKATTSRCCKVWVHAQYLTGGNTREEVRAVEEVQKQREQAQVAKKAKQKQENEAQIVARATQDPDEPFKGPLSSRTKAQLQDIAFALGISDEGKRDEIKARLVIYFESHPTLWDSPKYMGLFTCTHAS